MNSGSDQGQPFNGVLNAILHVTASIFHMRGPPWGPHTGECTGTSQASAESYSKRTKCVSGDKGEEDETMRGLRLFRGTFTRV